VLHAGLALLAPVTYGRRYRECRSKKPRNNPAENAPDPQDKTILQGSTPANQPHGGTSPEAG
jgi:hypothetical protein